MKFLKKSDSQIEHLIAKEQKRQKEQLQMIPSENYASKNVMKAVGSVFMNKYSEGQIGKRYYQGNKIIDEVETLCKKRALKAFGLDPAIWSVNVQALSGTPANLAVETALLEPGEKILAMYLYDGGHLSHGWMYKEKKITFTSKVFNIVYYHVDPETKVFNYSEIEKIALKEKPKLIISGGTAYPREINYKRMKNIAKKAGAYYLSDIAHEAGLVSAGANKSPFPYADVVTMTTHKTLRGPRGALIFSKKELTERIDKAVFPGLQGGPHNHTIAGIAVCLSEALKPSFKKYARQVVENAQTLAKEFVRFGYDVVSGGTDKHLVLVDLRNKSLSGKTVAVALEEANIIVNANTVPFDTASPMNPSGLRMGTPAITTRGMKKKEMKKIAGWMHKIIVECANLPKPDKEEKKIAKEVSSFSQKFPSEF